MRSSMQVSTCATPFDRPLIRKISKFPEISSAEAQQDGGVFVKYKMTQGSILCVKVVQSRSQKNAS